MYEVSKVHKLACFFKLNGACDEKDVNDEINKTMMTAVIFIRMRMMVFIMRKILIIRVLMGKVVFG